MNGQVGDGICTALDVFTPGQLHDQGLVHRRDGQRVEGVQALERWEVRGGDPALDHALVVVDEFQFGETRRIVGLVSTFSGALGASLRYSLKKVDGSVP